LKTAGEVLAALHLLAVSPDGVTAEVLGHAVGKSTATARYLLNTLRQEGYARRLDAAGRYVLCSAPPWGRSWGHVEPVEQRGDRVGAPGRRFNAVTPEPPLGRAEDPLSRHELPESLADALTELYWRTRQRSYLARWDGEATVIVDARGHQGLAHIPDLHERIPVAQAHALAVTKALGAMSPEVEQLMLAEPNRTAFTVMTITTTAGLKREFAEVRRDGVAVDREEFAEGFCCVAAPILAPGGEVAASIGVSSPAGLFDEIADTLTAAVREVAAKAVREWRMGVAVSGERRQKRPGKGGSWLNRPGPVGCPNPLRIGTSSCSRDQ